MRVSFIMCVYFSRQCLERFYVYVCVPEEVLLLLTPTLV